MSNWEPAWEIAFALDEIKGTYGDTASVTAKRKSLQKFGHHALLGSSVETIALLPNAHETYLTSNLITTISSSSTSDTDEVKMEGHTMDGNGNLTFVVQTATLLGRNQVTLTTPLARISRLYNNTTTGTDLVGSLSVYEDDTDTAGVPDTDALVHLQTDVGHNQSEKCATSLSSTDYWIVTSASAMIQKKTSGTVDMDIEIMRSGNVFRKVAGMVATTTGSSMTEVTFSPPLIVPPNADIRVVGVAAGSSTEVSAALHGYLAKVVA